MAEIIDPLEGPVNRILAARDRSALMRGAPRFSDPLVDAFSLASTAAGTNPAQVPDPLIERDLLPADAVAAASGLMIAPKPVAGKKWWRYLPSPVVARMNGRPIALAPGGFGVSTVASGTRDIRSLDLASPPGPPAVEVFSDLPQKMPWYALIAWSVRQQRWPLWSLGLLAVITGLTSLLLPATTSALFDFAIPWGNLKQTAAILAAFAVASVGAAILVLVRNLFVIRLRDTSDSRLSPGVVAHVLKLPARFFRTMPTGEVVNRTLSVETARLTVDDSVPVMTMASAFGIANLLYLAFLDPAIGITLTVVVAALVAVSVVIQIRAKAALAAVLAARSKTDSLLLEYLKALVPIRVAAAETKAFARLADLQAQWLEALSLRIRRLNMAAPLATVGSLLINVIVVAQVVSLEPAMPAREFLPVYAAVVQLTVAMTIVSANLTRLWEIGPVFARMDPLLDAAVERPVPGRRPGQLSGALRLTNVVFGYDPAQPPLFTGLNVTISPGEFVAIVGPSGSGKSTILRLLLGFEQPWSGVITYDDNDLQELDPAAVRRQIGTVTQSALPFGATVRECVCGPRHVSDEQLWETLRQAGLEDTVRDSVGGLDAAVGDQGAALSGGQRQRLMIARALLGQPRIVLLDEATSALDNVSQEIVMSAIMELPVTRIAIAHRLSTIARADRILVVADGRVVEEGTPQELRARNGYFARLAARQEF